MNSKRFLTASAVILFAGALSFLAAANSKTETWKGYVTDTWCGLHRETEKPTVACTNLCLSNKGAKYALFDVVNNKLYVLNPQEQAAKFAAQLVTVTGTLTGSYKGQLGEAQVTGTVTGNDVVIEYKVDAQGQVLAVKYTGKVDGNSMSGKVSLGQLGEGTFKGTKQ